MILRASRRREEEGDLAAATAQMEGLKGKESSISGILTQLEAEEAQARTSRVEPIRKIVFACDAGMGSSAMGASVLRNKLKKAGFEDVSVVNVAIANLDDSYDLVVTHQDLTLRARDRTPSAQHVSVATSWPAPDTTRSSTRSSRPTPKAPRRAERGNRGRAPLFPPPAKSSELSPTGKELARMSDVLTLSQIRMPGVARARTTPSGRPARSWSTPVVEPAYIDSMFDRERSVSTYMGNYLAILHGTNESKERSMVGAVGDPRSSRSTGTQRKPVRPRPRHRQGGHMDIRAHRHRLLRHRRGRQAWSPRAGGGDPWTS